MIIQFSIGTSRTVNLGNFESLRIEASVVVSVDEGGDFPQIKAAAQTELRQLLEETYRSQYRKKGEPYP